MAITGNWRFVAICINVIFLAQNTRGQSPATKIDLAAIDAKIKPQHRLHWAYQPIESPPIPSVKNSAWVRNPIDAFILANLENDGWQPAPTASSRVLLRRGYLDLLGLPPTLAEQEDFLNDKSPDRWQRLIHDLLARPGYGERWGRHWLDVVRYAESNGYERDAAKPFVWRYRDYVIRAFNQDKPFDRFVLEQLAGDELPDADTETVIATGYNRLGPWDDEPADPQQDRFDQLDDLVSTTSMVFLGLTMGCARCHDHKFDALTTHDYYRFIAIFNTLQRARAGRTELVLPAGSKQAVAQLAERNRQIDLIRKQALLQSAMSKQPAGLAFATSAIQAWKNKITDLPSGYFLHEPSLKPPATHLLMRGKAAQPGPKVQPGFPTVLVKHQPKFPPPGKHTSLRRLTLAKWIASPKNPLTARVIVNRVWQHHFGEGIVRTPNDFGVIGQAPTHPKLLDWLASWFMENGWSLKKLHVLIMSSNTYRMSTEYNAEYAKADPENETLWRFPMRRLPVEVIRDAMLAVSGQLNRKMYGPSMYPQVPKDALKGHSDPSKIWKPFNEREASRRTAYAFVKRSFVVPFLETLDFCDTAQSTGKRQVTTVAPQALTLFNGDFVMRQAKHLASRLVAETGREPKAWFERAYRLALCRPPTAKETAMLLRFFEREIHQLIADENKKGKSLTRAEAEDRALVQICRVILNLNEFVYMD